MDSERLLELQSKLKKMDTLESSIRKAEGAVNNFDAMTSGRHNVSVCIGNTSNSCGSVSIHGIDEMLINIVKAGFIAHLECLKSKFKKMEL